MTLHSSFTVLGRPTKVATANHLPPSKPTSTFMPSFATSVILLVGLPLPTFSPHIHDPSSIHVKTVSLLGALMPFFLILPILATSIVNFYIFISAREPTYPNLNPPRHPPTPNSRSVQQSYPIKQRNRL